MLYLTALLLNYIKSDCSNLPRAVIRINLAVPGIERLCLEPERLIIVVVDRKRSIRAGMP